MHTLRFDARESPTPRHPRPPHRERLPQPPLHRPIDPIRTLGRALVRGMYRFDVQGLEHVPERGPALVLANHVGFIDWLLIGAALPRTPRFVMHQAHFNNAALRPFFDRYGTIPIATRREDPRLLGEAAWAIDDALAAGHLVMLHPEGTMSPDGELSPLRPGFTRILRRRPVDVVPIGIRGVWGSFFSRSAGPPMSARPRRFRARVELVIGRRIAPSEASLEHVERRLRELRGERR